MTSIVNSWPDAMVVCRSVSVPDYNSGRFGNVYGIERLPTEPGGSTTLTLTNVVAGSRYRIERQGDGSLATPTANAEGVAGASTVVITLDYYAAGSANNDVKIKVRNASGSPSYKPFETLATLSSAAQSIYVGQIADE